MNMYALAENALVLFPQAVTTQIHQSRLIQCLQQQALIAQTFESEEGTAYLPGAGFAQHISFMGCAPAIDTALPSTGQSLTNFYAVRCVSSEAIEFLGNAATRPPRCPHCKAFLSNWQTPLKQWQAGSSNAFMCPDCGTRTSPELWHWRKRGGFARTAIWIHGVFEGLKSVGR